MTEIPEHLLKRSRDRRAALGLGGGDAGEAVSAAPAASTSSAVEPAAAASTPVARATPAAVEPPTPEPVPYYVEAARRRKRVPVWAMPVIAGMFFWAPVYLGTLELPPVEGGPLAAGEEIYGATCAGCHGATGGGGAGRQLNGGEVLVTFPDWRDQVAFVEQGSAGFIGVPYGDPERPGGAHIGGDFGNMPPQSTVNGGGLSRLEILEVVLYERVEHGGEVLEESELLAYIEALEASGEELPAEGPLPELELAGVAAGE
ncbi:MAG: hypothetical protein JJE52_16315 [Acidimicrobiia bacterium]|nr:hypothetical protein [Acidimicrobiia bacterium]